MTCAARPPPVAKVGLGARQIDVLGMVMRQGMSMIALGTTIGLILAAAASRLLAAFLLGVQAIDLAAFVGATVLSVGVGLTACYLPARRAAKIDPIVALRCE